jgi:hypothetical protein
MCGGFVGWCALWTAEWVQAWGSIVGALAGSFSAVVFAVWVSGLRERQRARRYAITLRKFVRRLDSAVEDLLGGVDRGLEFSDLAENLQLLRRDSAALDRMVPFEAADEPQVAVEAIDLTVLLKATLKRIKHLATWEAMQPQMRQEVHNSLVNIRSQADSVIDEIDETIMRPTRRARWIGHRNDPT